MSRAAAGSAAAGSAAAGSRFASAGVELAEQDVAHRGCVGLAALATLAQHRTGTATGPAALNAGYALGLAVAAALFVLAAVVAVCVLPGRRAGDAVRPPAPKETGGTAKDPDEHRTDDELEGTPS